MLDYKQAFIKFAIEEKVLCFGEFTLKSGRVSPYFFNAGLFQTGSALHRLSAFYAQAIIHAKIDFDMFFGPAYKGIPLVSTIAAYLFSKYQQDYPFAYNRKEVKNHGEGGLIVGADLLGKVLVIDDVITAGTAIREVVDILAPTQAIMGGVVVSLDRQERGSGSLSAIQEVERDLSCPVISIIGLDDLISYAKNTPDFDMTILDKIQVYQANYGINQS